MGTETKPSGGHMGTKFMALFIGLVLATVYTVLQFFTHPTLEVSDLYGIALVWAFFTIVIPLIAFLAEILWRYAHMYSEKFPIQMSNTLCAITGVYRR